MEPWFWYSIGKGGEQLQRAKEMDGDGYLEAFKSILGNKHESQFLCE
jgi:hypothetical protein